MSWLSTWSDPGKGHREGQKDLNHYYGEAQGYLNPYNQNGQDQYKNLQEYIDKLKNPAALYDEWSKGYKESDAAKQNETMAQEHGLNAANSMGLMGSNTALNAIQSGTSQIVNEDKQKYLDDLMNKYMQGAGLINGVYNTGAGAAGQQSTNATNMGENTAGMTFGNANSTGDLFGKTAGAVGTGVANVVTGGKWGTTGGKK